MFKFLVPLTILALLPTGGCLHHASPTFRPDLSDARTETYVSDCEHRNTGVHHHVVERIGPIADGCETIDVEVTEYDQLGELVVLERFRLRCGAKTAVTRYQCKWGSCEKTRTADYDRDGYVDAEWTEQVADPPRTPTNALADTR